MPRPILPRCLDLLVDPPPALRLAAAVVALALALNLFFHGAQPYSVGFFPEPWDKLAHLVVFGGIAALVWIVVGSRGFAGFACPIAVAIGIGMADEIAQSALPGRSASLLDFGADLAGAAFAVAALSVLRARRSRFT